MSTVLSEMVVNEAAANFGERAAIFCEGVMVMKQEWRLRVYEAMFARK